MMSLLTKVLSGHSQMSDITISYRLVGILPNSTVVSIQTTLLNTFVCTTIRLIDFSNYVDHHRIAAYIFLAAFLMIKC